MFVFGVFLINLAYTIYRPVKDGFSWGALVNILLALAFLVLFFYARIFALTVQDRVIRLEMRMRLAQLLPGELRPRIPEFSVGQLVALRFASDAELPALARKVLDEKLNDRKAVKQLVKDWQADYLRA
jgi:hypothetical protein